MKHRRGSSRTFLMLLLALMMTFGMSFAAQASVGKAKITKATAGESQVTLKWKKVSGATGYAVYIKSNDTIRQINKGKESSLKGKTSLTIKKLTNGYTYGFYVAAVDASGAGEKSDMVKATPKVKKPAKVAKARVHANGNGTVKLKWAKTTNASGYYILQKTDEGYKKVATVKKGSTVTATIKNLKNGTVYYFKVQAYRTVDGVTAVGSMSDVVEGRPNVKSAAVKSVHTYYYKVKVTKKTTATPVSGGKSITLKKGTTIKLIKKASGNGKSTALIKGVQYKVSNKALNLNKYSFIYKNKTLYSKATAEAFVNYKGYKTTASKDGVHYLIWINTYTQRLYLFTGEQYNWTCKKVVKCATGMPGTYLDYEDLTTVKHSETPLGKSAIWKKDKTWIFAADQYAYWASRISGGAIHSWLYYPTTMKKWTNVGSLGTPSSHGCVRVDISVAKYIYDHCPLGTTVVVY